MKIRSKIALMLAGVFFCLILLFSGFIYFFISRYGFNDFYKRLETRSVSTAKSELEVHSDSELHREFKKAYLEILPEEKNYILEIKKGSTATSLAYGKNLPLPLLKDIMSQKRAGYRKGNLMFYGIKYHTKGKNYIVITSARNHYFTEYTSYLRSLLIISIGASLILVALIAFWLSKRLITPIRRITDKVNRIGTENLNLRLDEPLTEDELGELARTFNNMLDRLETSFETQNNFISNASHELNTPLTSIIGEADVALTRKRSEAEYIEVLQSILEEAEKLDKKTKALLFLAQTGFNGKAMKTGKVRMDQLILDVQETINRIYPNNNVHLDFSRLPDNPLQLKVNGNEQLLHLALSNIIVNACKYSNNRDVDLSITSSGEWISIQVKDKGVGIPEAEIGYIYDPFFRASNTANFEGYGIGLPLTRNIIKLHHGEMHVRSVFNIGTEVEIRLPVGKFSL